MKHVQKEIVSRLQLFVLIVLFNIGSTLILNIGKEAKNNAWIAILMAGGCGILIFLFNMYLTTLYSQKNLFEMAHEGFGKSLGRIISVGYIFYFFISAGLSLRNIGELMTNTIFGQTPIEIFIITLVFTCAYILFSGIEVLGRSTEIFFPYSLIFLGFIGLGLLFSNELHFYFLEPFLGDGIRPVLKAVFPFHLALPFGEIIAFLVLIPQMKSRKKVRVWGIWAIIFSSLILCYSSLLQTMTLGPIKERASYPLLSAVTEISLLKFIERMDLLIVFIMLLGILVKVSIFFYAGLKGLEHLFNRPYRTFVFPITTIIAFSALLPAETYLDYVKFGRALVFIQIPFQFLIPSLLLLIGIWIQRKKGGKNHEIF